MRLYGIDNFIFEVIEYCDSSELISKETFQINTFQPEYNSTAKLEYQIVQKKLNPQLVREIQSILMQYTQKELPYNTIAEYFNIHRDTVEDINNGVSWHDSYLNYPIRKPNKKQKQFCCICGKELSLKTKTNMCKTCFGKSRTKDTNELPVSREELKGLIRNKSFLFVGEMFNVSDNAIRKWCKKYSLPYKRSVINSMSDEDWNKL